MNLHSVTAFLALLILQVPGYSQIRKPEMFYGIKPKGFIENKGQILDQEGQPNSEIKYLYVGDGLKLLLRENSFSYEVFNEIKKTRFSEAAGKETISSPEEYEYKSHRIDITLPGVNPHPEIEVENPCEASFNYYSDGKMISGVRSYAKVIYKNIYDRIDLVFYARDGGVLKYDFIIHPGGQASNIALQYSGSWGIRLNNGELSIKSAEGQIFETMPLSYIKETGETVPVKYSLSGNVVKFEADENQGKTFVIDPYIRWSTYFGGDNLELIYDIKTSGYYDVYLTGLTSSSNGIATWGSYQQTKTNHGSSFLTRFDRSGRQIWGTYINSCEIYGLDIDPVRKAIYLAGWTDKSLATSGAHQTVPGGGQDGLFARFSLTGYPVWITLYGGDKMDRGGTMAVDNNGDVYGIGYSQSDSNIATSNAFQKARAGSHDIFLVKFDSTGKRTWCTYYGGDGTDGAGSIVFDSDDNPYIAGSTFSKSGFIRKPTFQSSLSSVWSGGFLSKFDPNGYLVWDTYYSGGGYHSRFSRLAFDPRSQSIYAVGTTDAGGLATSGTHEEYFQGNTDGLIVRFDTSGKRIWSTYYGGNKADEAGTVCIDDSGYIYISGATQSTSGIANDSAFQKTLYTNFKNDGFIAKFDSSCKRIWGSYFGGEGTEEYIGMALSKTNDIYLSGKTWSTENIATKNADQTSKSSNDEGFLARITGRKLDIGLTRVTHTKDTFCLGDSMKLKVAMKNYGVETDSNFRLIINIAGPDTTDYTHGHNLKLLAGKADTAFVKEWFYLNKPGTYKIAVTREWPDDSLINDTVYSTLYVSAPPIAGFTYSGTCLSDSFVFTDTSKSDFALEEYLWDFGDSITSTDKTPSHKYAAPGKYKVKLKVSSRLGCFAETEREITVQPMPSAKIKTASACAGLFILFTDVSTGNAVKRKWYFGDGSTDTSKYVSHKYLAGGTYNVSLVVHTKMGCKDSTAYALEVFPKPKAGFSASHLCRGTPVIFEDTSTILSGSYTRKWYFGDGTTDTVKNPSHIYTVPGNYTISLALVSDAGCKDSIARKITITDRHIVIARGKNACKGSANQFFDSTKAPNGSIVKWVWDFGDGNTSTTQNASHTYSSAGKYSVRLFIETAAGCLDSGSTSVVVYENPDPAFVFSKNDMEVRFKSQDSTAIDHDWDFGDGSTSDSSNPVHVYANDGTYGVMHVVTDSNGCKSSFVDSVQIETIGIGDISGSAGSWKAFPNPVLKDEIHFEKGYRTRASFRIVSMTGSVIVEYKEASASRFTVQLPSGLTKGIYFAEIKEGDEISRIKLFKL